MSEDTTAVQGRLTEIRAQIYEYEQAESDQEQRDLLAEIETELDQLRETVEQEVQKGESKANDILDEIETTVSNLRN